MRRAPLVILLMLASAPSAWALPPEDMIPVDQAVADLDPLTTSLRQQEWGLWEYGQDTSLLEVNDPRPQVFADQPYLMQDRHGVHDRLYYRIGRGYRARVPRSDYLIPISRKWKIYDRNVPPVHDRDFIELVPTGAVFELSPQPMFVPGSTQTQEPPPPEQAGGMLIDDQPAVRIDGRIDGRVDGRIDGRFEP